jgi:DMSO/TMAO reductase YedYZ molybdopterin-dependent catalytic subunit
VDLQAMEQVTAELPIACVEGWSTTQRWTGVRLRDLARMAGLDDPVRVEVRSLQPRGALRRTTLNQGQLMHPQALLALEVNGADLSLDHGFPARVIVPALPGVHCTKWVGVLAFS